ncbi:hypothetical protein PIB30_064994 [Stylosanthes scabra]|uniref:Uncharacterized protein n=1 Tax=Stylosanthes scabra TaxID=79078 RepID=A0ABU6QME1_9FABA|nr:hypothetical protein [Stylosanthes scabra]
MAVMADFRFFKFILAGDVNQLRLAAAFSAAARDSMANPVTLVTTNGIEFRVAWIVQQARLNRIVLTRGGRISPGITFCRKGIYYCSATTPQEPCMSSSMEGIAWRSITEGTCSEDVAGGYRRPVFPRRFATQFGAVLPDQLSLVTSTCWSRRVRWTRDTKGIIRLGMTGWPWMCLHYGLRPNTLVVFRYHPPATMYVLFYRPSTMEVNYLQHGDDITRSTCMNNPRDTPARHMVDCFRSRQPFFTVPVCFMRGSPNLLVSILEPHILSRDDGLAWIQHMAGRIRAFRRKEFGLLGERLVHPGHCARPTAGKLVRVRRSGHIALPAPYILTARHQP